jgi:enoyl-CoA hydratase
MPKEGSMSDDVVLVEIDRRVAVITLNRPEKRNALNRAVQQRVPEVVAQLDADDGVDVLVLTGADPAFCAGLDLKEFGAGPMELGVLPDQRGPIPPRTKPLIGAINGVAVTGGLELALNCDFLVASERAAFADTHTRVGILPGWGLTVLLPQAVGVRRARQMSTTGNYVDAPTALAWGLVNEVVPHEQLIPRARQLAADIVSNDQAALRRLLRVYDDVTGTTTDEGWRIEAAASREWMARGQPGEVERRRQAVIERGRAQRS